MKDKKSRRWISGYILIFLFPVVFILLFYSSEHHFSSLPYYGPFTVAHGDTTYYSIHPFSLSYTNGKKFNSSILKGNIYIAEYFQNESRMRLLQDKFNQKIPVRFVSMSPIPECNNKEFLSAYAEVIKADTSRWFFLYAPVENLIKIAEDEFFKSMSTNDKISEIKRAEEEIRLLLKQYNNE